jgi:hypothetical protein
MTVERIGVLMVHGIGTNPPNQFLVDQTRKIVAAMSEEVASIDVLSEPAVQKAVPDKYVVDYAANMVRVEAKIDGANPRTLQIDFNEVYWADLGEKPTLSNQINFWFWALSMWSVAARDHSPLDGANAMYQPKGGGIRWWERPLLGFFGILFLLGAATIGLYNVIAARIKLPRLAISDILTAYLGDVMLYSESDGADDPAVCDFALPPRVGIRARMVDALVEFAMRDYDRWFLVAHSQGTVIAYNGLMETAAALPNYLTEKRWAEVQHAGFKETQAAVEGAMMPRRPTWLQPTDGIGRCALFEKLGGFLTFGSAIGKFRGIWPIIVPANNDEYVFDAGFRWINVYDWTDPVSGSLRAYSRETGFDKKGKRLKKQAPVVGNHVAAKIDYNISYRSGWIWLLSHLQYLDYYSRAYRRPSPLLVTAVAGWLMERKPQEESALRWKALVESAPNAVLRNAIAATEVVLATVAVWLSTAALLWWLVDHKWLRWLDTVYLPVLAGVALVVAGVLNLCGWAMKSRKEHGGVARGVRWFVVLLGGASIVAASARLFCCFKMPAWINAVFQWLAGIVAEVLALRWIDIPLRWLAGTWAEFLSLPWVKIAVEWLTGLLYRPDAIGMSLGLLSLTVTLIVVLGGLRWLIQPIPAPKPKPKSTPKT